MQCSGTRCHLREPRFLGPRQWLLVTARRKLHDRWTANGYHFSSSKFSHTDKFPVFIAGARCCTKCRTFVAPNYIAYVQSETKRKSDVSFFRFVPFASFYQIFLFSVPVFYLFVAFIFALFFSILFLTSSLLFPFIPVLCVPCLFFLFHFFTSPLLVSVFLSLFTFSFLHSFLPCCASYFWDGTELFTAADTRRL